MKTSVVDHPLAAQLLTRLRDKDTNRAVFRQAVEELSVMLLFEATRGLVTEAVTVETPLGPAVGRRVVDTPLVVPILRAGLGMLGAVLRVMPGTETGFIGVARNESSFQPEPYMNAVPEQLHGRQVLVLDPMLATGGSLEHACRILAARGAGHLTAVVVLAAPEGLERLSRSGLDLEVWTAAIDDRLNEQAYIVPGLGDAGDRLFGTA
ncbi:MAG: uracil phosphoribosyltransferase [Acidimicrobiaceae bacterium]|jgi:uracil phosphoribosyltransferase|nr:uracil phosphoribosyltransferase [Acidimicrobiaceae bacterium]MDQ1413926.1 uracil phosphoribosyltransferase [Acidimicrobiaceae bacterium]MDQ1414784.1 uracil phosphoribosyltransferase [Acidimicrobiaceae bacterium]